MDMKDTTKYRDTGYGLASYRRLADKSGSFVDSDSNWMITLSDVMSLLLIFFIMFFIMTKKQVQSEEPPPPVIAQGSGILPGPERFRDKIRDEITIDIRSLDMGDQISVLATKREIMISMKEKVAFKPGETDILEISEPVLTTIAEIIRKYPDFRVEIDGHTDNIPIMTTAYPSNWELSVARATSVLKYFIHSHGIDPSRFSVRGNADQKPLVANDTKENRALNRRVEIRLKRIEDI